MLFIVSMIAYQYDDDTGKLSMVHMPMMSQHESLEEAERHHMGEALSRWPLADGWRAHHAHACGINITTEGGDPTVVHKFIVHPPPIPRPEAAQIEELEGAM